MPEALYVARTMQVLELLAQGASNAQIAQTLYLSPKTIRNHLSAILAKLRVALLQNAQMGEAR